MCTNDGDIYLTGRRHVDLSISKIFERRLRVDEGILCDMYLTSCSERIRSQMRLTRRNPALVLNGNTGRSPTIAQASASTTRKCYDFRRHSRRSEMGITTIQGLRPRRQTYCRDVEHKNRDDNLLNPKILHVELTHVRITNPRIKSFPRISLPAQAASNR